MKALMSEKLRNILNNPRDARELQKQLSTSNITSITEKFQSHGLKPSSVIEKPNHHTSKK